MLADTPALELERVKSLVRAATCFEFAGQHRDAAWAYYDAGATLFARQPSRLAGELFNWAGGRFRTAREDFNAGHSYQCAGQAFAEMPEALLNTQDNIPPVPLSAGKFSAAAGCYLAAADAFLESNEKAWARGACWGWTISIGPGARSMT